jgi:lipid A 3-O-deacylase
MSTIKTEDLADNRSSQRSCAITPTSLQEIAGLKSLAIGSGANARAAKLWSRRGRKQIACCATLVSAALFKAQAQEFPSTKEMSQITVPGSEVSRSVWESGVGQGFLSTAQSISVSAGANYGIAAFGSREAHDLALVNLTYGHMLSGVCGRGHWYQGNPEFRLELFTGAQFSPSSEWLVGLTPHLRYNFATDSRWVPYLDGGAGVTATGIRPPDLSGTFEFNLQAGGGVLWFLRDNVAITLDAHYTHWSCAGLHKPNLGLNGVTGMLGVAFFF